MSTSTSRIGCRALCVVVVVAACLPLSVPAQDYNAAVTYSNMQQNNLLMNQQMQGSLMAMTEVERASRNVGAKPRDASVRQAAGGMGAVDLGFRPDPNVSQEMEAGFMKNLRQRDPSMAGLVERELAQKDMISRFKADVGPYGLRWDDLGDTATAYWVVMWMTANQQNLPTREQVQAARTQVHAQLAKNPTAAEADDRRRQQMAEVYIYETMWMISLRNSASSSSQRKQVADKAQDIMLGQGLDMRQMRLTDAGFAPKQG